MPPKDPFKPSSAPEPRPINPGEPVDSTPYDFIMTPGNKAPKKAVGLPLPLPLKGGSKLMYIAGGGVVLLLVVFLVLKLAGGSSSDPALTSIAQQQTEIARVANLQYQNLSNPDTQNFVINTQLSMLSAQSDFLQYLSSNGAGIPAKQLNGALNSKTDSLLTDAQASGSLDSTVQSTLVDELTHYQQTIKSTYTASHNSTTRTVLKNLYDQAGLLEEQAKE